MTDTKKKPARQRVYITRELVEYLDKTKPAECETVSQHLINILTAHAAKEIQHDNAHR
jgi:hypothetical protein